tara:strand:+ start:1757 stop:2089 length:333 start_codon:yes stop_codon:yes gene_type:complete
MNPYLENLIASGIAVTAVLFAIAIIHTVYYYVTRNDAESSSEDDLSEDDHLKIETDLHLMAGYDTLRPDEDLVTPAILRRQLDGRIPGNSHQRRIARRKAEKIERQIFPA